MKNVDKGLFFSAAARLNVPLFHSDSTVSESGIAPQQEGGEVVPGAEEYGEGSAALFSH